MVPDGKKWVHRGYQELEIHGKEFPKYKIDNVLCSFTQAAMGGLGTNLLHSGAPNSDRIGQESAPFQCIYPRERASGSGPIIRLLPRPGARRS